MARPLRIEFPGAVYHITSRGNAREDIFQDNADRSLFLKTLNDVAGKYNWLCHAYCLMTNHYHLLIETLDPNLSLGMRQLNGVFTQAYNRRHNRAGHIFQGRFKSILVEKESHLLELCRYVVLNPVRAGMVEHPDQWEWSSYIYTVNGRKKKPDFLEIDWILGQFFRRKTEARQRYRKFIMEAVEESGDSPWEKMTGQIFLGGNAFISKMEELLEDRKTIGELPRAQRYANRPSLAEIFPGIGNKKKRNKMIVKAHLDHGYTLKELADYLGIHYTTVSKVIKNHRENL